MATPTKAQLQSDLEALVTENNKLTAEIARLTRELEQCKTQANPGAVSTDVSFDIETHKFGVTTKGDAFVIIRGQGSDNRWRTFLDNY